MIGNGRPRGKPNIFQPQWVRSIFSQPGDVSGHTHLYRSHPPRGLLELLDDSFGLCSPPIAILAQQHPLLNPPHVHLARDLRTHGTCLNVGYPCRTKKESCFTHARIVYKFSLLCNGTTSLVTESINRHPFVPRTQSYPKSANIDTLNRGLCTSAH